MTISIIVYLIIMVILIASTFWLAISRGVFARWYRAIVTMWHDGRRMQVLAIIGFVLFFAAVLTFH